MTSEDLRSELERSAFIPLRLHLVSGKTLDIARPSLAFMLQNAVMVLRDSELDESEVGLYDVVALRNIERIEQLGPRQLSSER